MRKTWGQLAAGAALLGVGVAGGWAAGASGGSSTARQPGADPGPTTHPTSQAIFAGQLVAYDSCAGLLDALHTRGRAVVGPYGFGGQNVSFPYAATRLVPEQAADSLPASSAAPLREPTGSASDGSASLLHSSTNTQVADVDEPDTVKTDGRIMVSLDGQQLHIIDVRNPRLRSTIALPHPGSELLLAGDRVVVLSGGSSGNSGGGVGIARPNYGSTTIPTTATTTATVVDVANPDAPRVVRSWTFDAGQVAARVVGGTIRLVLTSPPPTADWAQPRDSSKAELSRATKINQAIVDATPLDTWLPHWSDDTNSAASHRLSACDAVATPSQAKEVGMVTVVSLDPGADRPGAGTSVFGAGDTAYAEGHHLYISAGTYSNDPPVAGLVPPDSGWTSTLHLLEFDLSDPAQARYLAAGTVKGQLHDSYALSEFQDHLRVTTSTFSAAMGSSTSVSVLAREGDKLVQVGRLDGLGSGEQVYAVRYIGDRGYVVTFRQIDPLHVIDLSNPAKPVLRGILTMPGYSSQLLPLPDHQLLGIGQSVSAVGSTTSGSAPSCIEGVGCTDTGSTGSAPAGIVEPNGVQLALFDVSDAAHPRLLDRHVLAGAYTQALSDPHAVTLAPGGGLVVIPSSSGLVGATIGSGHLTITTAPFTKPVTAQAGRTVIAGERLFELTDLGVAVRALPGLRQNGWVAF